MSRKVIIGLVILVSILALGFEISCPNPVSAMGEKPPKQGYKTHVSKYGFSVSYPADWYLWEEWRYMPVPESKKGWVPFGITNTNPNLGLDVVPEKERIGIDFNVWSAPEDLPREGKEKLIYIAREQQMASIDKLEIFEKDGIMMCLAYGIPRGDFKKYYHLFFYIPRSNSVAFTNSGFRGKKKLENVLDKIYFRLEE